jgi:hypothetical protein
MSFNLTSGDKVFINIISYAPDGNELVQLGVETLQAEVKGFTCYGIHYKKGQTWHHYRSYSFYGSGYHEDAYVIVLKDQWKLSRAIMFEHVRLRKFDLICLHSKRSVQSRVDYHMNRISRLRLIAQTEHERSLFIHDYLKQNGYGK